MHFVPFRAGALMAAPVCACPSSQRAAARALAALLAASLCGACADGGAGAERASASGESADEDGPVRSRERRKITCTPAAARKIDAAGLTPVETFDSMAVRFASGFGAQGGDERWTERSFTTLTEVGEACATATSQACADKVAFHPAPLLDSNCLQVCSEWSIVTTRGDEVERWAGPDETIALLAPIDSADEALMVVASHGYDVGCPFETVLGTFLPASEARATITPHEDGFEVNATRTTPISEEDIGNLIIARTTLQVSRAGDLTVLERREYPARITGF